MGKAVKGTAKFKTLKEEQELDIRYEKYKSIIAELTIMSDIFMRNVLKKAGVYRISPAGDYG